jgi:ABC-2 type transport system ATP-binding protein
VDRQEGKDWLDRLIEELDLGPFIHQPVRKLSLGQRMRCEIAAALIHKPKLLFLDEPTVGLDVLVKQKIRQFLRRLNETEKTTILLTTHDVTDIEALCKRVLVMDQGKLIFDGQLADLKEKWGAGTEVVFQFKRLTTAEEVQAALRLHDCQLTMDNGYTLTIRIPRGQARLPYVLSTVIDRFEVSDVKVKESSTEEIVRNIYSATSEAAVHV